jgi:hypothetical protein
MKGIDTFYLHISPSFIDDPGEITSKIIHIKRDGIVME